MTLVMVFLLCGAGAAAQNKLVIKDKPGVITSGVESILASRFANDSIELTSIIDTRIQCEYWIADLEIINGELHIQVTACNNNTAGRRNLGTGIISADEESRAMLVYFALSDIITHPYRETEETENVIARQTPVQQPDAPPDPGNHKTRYFFSPSSYSLEEGELYYNTLNFALHDIQYGLSESFSIGMGTTIAGFPFYLTPKISIPINELSSFAIGDMVIIGTWGTRFFGNLLYGTYTYGGNSSNVTIGAGLLSTSEGDLTARAGTPVFNFAALGQMSGHIFFITENYITRVKTKQTAYYDDYNEVTGEYTYEMTTFYQNRFMLYGMTGFRFINRSKDVVSWQVGLTYLYLGSQAVPLTYHSSGWYTSASERGRFITFPVVGYTRKFSTKY